MKSLLNSRIAIFGAGAIGSYIGSKLLEAGYTNVEFVARSGYEVLRDKGLTIKNYKSKEPYNIKVQAVNKLNGIYDLVFLCVKSKDTVSSVEYIKDFLGESGIIASVQNGVENPDLIGAYIPKERIITNVIYMTAVMQQKGLLQYDAEGYLIYGMLDGSMSGYSEFYDKIISSIDIKRNYTDNVKQFQWQKLMLNIVLNPLTALFRKTFYELSSNEEALSLSRHLFKEAQEAGRINGVEIADSEYDKIYERCVKHRNFKSSMYQDIEANRNPEIDAILGVIVRSHKKAGKEAPYSETILKVMNVLYGGWFQISPRLASDVLVINKGRVLLIERKNKPLGWAIPGGFVNLYESMEEAGVRELFEETGIKAHVEDIELLGIYSRPDRDPRCHTVSAVYVYFTESDYFKADDDAKDAKYFDINNLPEELAFDHREILEKARKKYFNN